MSSLTLTTAEEGDVTSDGQSVFVKVVEFPFKLGPVFSPAVSSNREPVLMFGAGSSGVQTALIPATV